MNSVTPRTIGISFVASVAIHVLLLGFAAWLFNKTPVLFANHDATEPESLEISSQQMAMLQEQEIEAPTELEQEENLKELSIPTAKDSQMYVHSNPNAQDNPAQAPPNARYISDRNSYASSKNPLDSQGSTQSPSIQGRAEPGLNTRQQNFQDGNDEADDPSNNAADEALPLSQTSTQQIDITLHLITQELPKIPVLGPAPRPGEKRFRAQTEANRVQGSLSNQSTEDALDTAATPTGIYMRVVIAAIEKKWHQLRAQQRDNIDAGRLRIRFYVNRFGRPEEIRIIQNEANPALTDLSLSAILQAELPVIPEDLLLILDKERVEIEYDINIY